MYTRHEIVIGVNIGVTLVLHSIECKIFLLDPSNREQNVSSHYFGSKIKVTYFGMKIESTILKDPTL